MNNSRILIVDDDRDVLETARMFLKQEFTTVILQRYQVIFRSRNTMPGKGTMVPLLLNSQ